MEIVSQVHAFNLKNFAKNRPEILVLTADLTDSCEAGLFKNYCRDRLITCGISEQNMMSIAGGLSREGFIPFVHTFAVFIYRRAYDQIAMSIAYPNLPVKMFGFLPGITTPGGATHQAIEDISVMRSLPNMNILECGDATDVESVLDVAYNIKGPVYIRMLRGEIPRLFDKNNPMIFGKSRQLSKGDDMVLITTGICTEEAIRATKALKKHDIGISHFQVTTLKPFNDERIMDAIGRSKYGAITMENHSIIGGIGTIISEKMAEQGLNKKILRMGINDTFLHGAGKHYLMKEYNLDAMSLIRQIEKMTDCRYNIQEKNLEAVRIIPTHSDAKEEAL
jgi:transketolase